jgi:hypothetical protein
MWIFFLTFNFIILYVLPHCTRTQLHFLTHVPITVNTRNVLLRARVKGERVTRIQDYRFRKRYLRKVQKCYVFIIFMDCIHKITFSCTFIDIYKWNILYHDLSLKVLTNFFIFDFICSVDV